MANERRGRPRAEDATDTKARIVLAAQTLFGERGYAAVSMDQLAAETGVNVRAIYHYFTSKRAVFDAAAAATFEAYGGRVVDTVLVQPDLRARLHAFVDLYRALYREERHVLAFLSVVMIDAVSNRGDIDDALAVATAPAEAIVAMNGQLVADARARGELSDAIADHGALALLQTIGMGLGLASLDDADGFLAMLDALDHLIDGTLLT